jgi:hypothetical protein
MMSKRTLDGMIEALTSWALEHDIDGDVVADLVNKIGKVPGNKSYQQSIGALALEIKHRVTLADSFQDGKQ